ncbi:MFS transporter [Corynebacterium sp. P3-F1]|uniref:MFS transporter n=1 Tax=Corynebacterium sp. P3-F1 TaxID=3059080 RepID=UPI00265CF12E|nr:MFS transporter [Corynebacterium sp. P3-F1]WKK61810.1 MFS transporter [Corynebacterium sp. P3-F1]
MGSPRGAGQADKNSVWAAPGFIPTLIAVAAAFGSWALLLPVVPVAVLDAGGSHALAGASTGVFMAATVLTQVFMPRLLRKFSYRSAIAFSAVLLGVPALAFIWNMDPSVVLAVSVLRGIGFGAMTVSEAAIIAELVPRSLLGKASGVFGASSGSAQMIALPLGLFLSERIGYGPVWILALVIAAVGGLACGGIPPIKGAQPDPVANGAVSAPTWKLVLVPTLALAIAAVAYSLIANFLPAAARDTGITSGTALGGLILAVINLAVMGARIFTGVVADRRGEPGTLMIPFQIAAAVGMFGFAACLASSAHPAWLVVSAVLFGAGFGAVQNESLLSMFYRLPQSKVSHASAVWNVGFDGGQGIGSFLFGGLIAGLGAVGAFAVSGVVVVAGIVMTTADWIVGKRRLGR